MAVGVAGVELLRGERGEPEGTSDVGDAGDRLVLTFGEAPTAKDAALLTARARDAAASEPDTSWDVDASVHVVRKGDTLTSIAQERLGDALRAADIARVNALSDPDRLRVGQVLRLP